MIKSLTIYKPIDINKYFLKTFRGLELIIGQPNDERHSNFNNTNICVFFKEA